MSFIFRRSLTLLAGVIATTPVVFMPQVHAQEEARAEIEEVITTGTRARERSVTQSAAPIDVITGEDFVNQGDTDLANLVRNVVPSFNVNAQPISDAATIVRPANLRGLAPDHTLVLVNGKRRHRSAVISWLGNGVSDGSQGPDLSVIPSIAVKQVEVLRDGASSQYGSDAIAGVMNFLLKDATEGATIEAKYGQYSEGDGDLFVIAGNVGLPFSNNGFANLSFEYGESDPTNRSVQRDDAAAVIAGGNTNVANPAQVWGSPLVEDDLKLFANIGLDLGNESEFYAHANMSSKHVDGGFFFRHPNTRSAVFGRALNAADLEDSTIEFINDDGELVDAAGNRLYERLVGDENLDDGNDCSQYRVRVTEGQWDPALLSNLAADDGCWSFLELRPGGFTPRFGGDVSDTALTAGVRGELDNGLRWDVSATGARSEVDFFIRNTVNASLGSLSPTFFDPGAYTQYEQAINADFAFLPTDDTSLAFGSEYRKEEFQVTVGQEESFQIGPLAAQGFSAASNGFPGFSNIAGGKFSRENIALYVDGEWEATEQLLLSGAVRWEDFQDFGTTTNGKIGANWRADNGFGVRATASTGFKAPTPGQSNAFNVTTEFDTAVGELVNRGTIPAASEVARFLGARPLGPEESNNFTFGVFFPLGAADVTIDYFDIDVDDRLSLSADFSLTEDQIEQLLREGVTSAANLRDVRFFTNDFDTSTSGIDVVIGYPVDWANGSNTDFSLVFNKTDTEVTRRGATIDAGRQREIEEGLPETRYNLSATHYFGPWRILGRASYYDDWFDSEDGLAYDGKTLFDAEAAYQMDNGFAFVLGAHNIFDEVPDDNPGARTGVGNRYSQYSPFGFNGALWYLRVRYDME